MVEAIGATLGYAVGIAATVTPPVAVVMMLFSARGRANSWAYLIAYTLVTGGVTVAALFIPGLEGDDAAPTNGAGWFKFALGALLVLGAVSQWRKRPAPGEEPEAPGWMEKIETMAPGGAFVLGLATSALNVKNIVLAVAAGATISSLAVSGSASVGALIVFIAVAVSPVLIPVIAYMVAGERLDATLVSARAWLLRNNAIVMAIVLLIFGVSLLGDGLEILGS